MVVLSLYIQVIRGDANKLLIFLKGGGGCWDEDSTVKEAQCSINVKAFPEVGMYARKSRLASSKFRDYTVVGVLYCR